MAWRRKSVGTGYIGNDNGEVGDGAVGFGGRKEGRVRRDGVVSGVCCGVLGKVCMDTQSHFTDRFEALGIGIGPQPAAARVTVLVADAVGQAGQAGRVEWSGGRQSGGSLPSLAV